MSLRIGILGSGQAAAIHSKTLRAVAPHVQRWYASREPDRANRMAARFGGVGHVGSYEAAVDSPTLDALILAVPPSLHREWALRGLAAGKHVIVEKPPFLTTVEFDEVAAAADAAGRQLLVAENYFYKPLTRVLRDTIRRGDVGRVLMLQLNALKRQKTGDWRDDGGMAGGGALFEGGIHWVSLLANIGLTPVRIRASLPSSEPGGIGPADQAERRIERSAIVTIEYAEGAVATLSYSWDLPSLINGVRMSRLYGTAGTLKFETNGLFATLSGHRRRLLVPGVADLAGYRAMMTDFLAAIEHQHPPAYTPALGRRDLHLIEQAYASASGL